MRALITGGGGLLGSALIRHAPRGVDLHATRRSRAVHGAPAHDLDLSDAAAVRELLERLRPELVIHTAYGTAQPGRDILAATESVVAACAAVGAALVHVSTDALFDGERAPYEESDLPAPITGYGAWKARAEDHVRTNAPAAAIIRTSLIVSLDPLDPASEWVACGARGEAEVQLFVDELRCPILADDLALLIWEIAELEPSARAGVWHLAGPEALSRYTIGLLVAAHLGLDASRLKPAFSDPQRPRPRDLRMRTARADAALRNRARTIAAGIAAARLASPLGGAYNSAHPDGDPGARGPTVPPRPSSS